jgi:SAM-dependent methyltransferase
MNAANAVINSLRNKVRWLLMPGLDLFTRRRQRLCRQWSGGPRKVLDAGSGNGWFAYLAYRSGASVVAVNFSDAQVAKAIRFYNIWRKIPETGLKFINLNLYDLSLLEPGFDEIICYETLEHIKDDNKICREFWRLLKKGGVLHLCCPHAEHSRWRNEPLDLKESGAHVRAGYTLKSYNSLLEPIGFRIVHTEGMGGPMLTKVWSLIEKIRGKVGNIFSIPFILLMLPFVWFDPKDMHCPYCLYVKAVK